MAEKRWMRSGYGEMMRRRNLSVVHEMDGLRILTGTAHPQLAMDVASLLGYTSEQVIKNFDGGEYLPKIMESVRRKDVYIIQPGGPPDPSRFHLELCFMLDAAKRASASELNAVVPYLPFSRQERQTDQQNPNAPRESISAKVIIDQIFDRGADRLVVCDVHADAEQGFTNSPFDNLHAGDVLIPRLRERIPVENTVILSPDFGGAKRAKKYNELLHGAGIAIAFKERKDGKAETFDILGSVENKDVVIVDDILASGESIENATIIARAKGAGSVSVAVAHGFFLTKDDISAMERMRRAGIRKVYVTDTIDLPQAIRNDPLIEVVSIAPVLAEAIKRIHLGQPIHQMQVK